MCLAIPGKVVAIEGEGFERVATVSFDGLRKRIYLAFTPEAEVDDYVLVHVGFAIARIDLVQADRLDTLLERISNADSS